MKDITVINNREFDKIKGENQKSGIDLIGEVPWGTHICQFYKTEQDLIEILVPYFQAGLKNNEFCMWIISEPRMERDAKKAMTKAIPNFDDYLKKGQIEFIPYFKWYLKDGLFNIESVIISWIDKLNQVFATGYKGLRVSGNAVWFEKKDWKNVTEYEEEINNVIGKYHMIAICTYSLDKCGASEIIDIVANHQVSLMKREGKWEVIESSERKRAKEMEKQNIQDLKYLSETAIGFVQHPPEADIYKYIAEQLKRLVGDSIVIVNSFEPESDTMKVRAITGMGKLSKQAFNILNNDPEGITYKINEKARQHLLSGKFHKVPGKMRELTFEQMPEPVCNELEELFEIREIHSMGFAWEGELFGDVVIILRGNTELKNRKVIEAYINQAAVALQRKRAEEAFRETNDKYQNIFQTINEAVIYVDSFGKIIDVNDNLKNVFGYTRDEVLGKNFMDLDIISIKSLPKIIELFKHAARIGKIIDTSGKGINLMELEARHKNGSRVIVEASTTLLKKEERAEGFLSIIRDISDRKRAEEELRQSEERFRLAFEGSPIGMVLIGSDNRFLKVNKTFSEMLGYSEEELINQTFVDITHSEDIKKDVQLAKKLFNGAIPSYKIQKRYVKKDKGVIWVDLTASVVRDTYKKPLYGLGMVEDITERKLVEKERKRRSMRFDLEEGNLYLVKEHAPGLSTEAFADLIKIGYLGYVISRTPKRDYNVDSEAYYDFRWMSERGSNETLSPKLKNLEKWIESLPRKAVILLDRLDYLVSINGFKQTLSFVQNLKELAYFNDHVIILSIDPSILSEKEIRQLEKETLEVKSQLKKMIPKDLFEVLEFVNDYNQTGARPTYSKIGGELGISQPTVRKRVRQLIRSGYVRQETKGRTKVMELTEKGRAILIK